MYGYSSINENFTPTYLSPSMILIIFALTIQKLGIDITLSSSFMILAKVVFRLLIASIGIRTLANTWYVVPYSQDKVECPAKEKKTS